MSVTWRFREYPILTATREPPLPPNVTRAMNDLLGELDGGDGFRKAYLQEWSQLLAKHDPEAALAANVCEVHVVGDSVHLYPLFDQWDDVSDVWVPLADVQEMFSQYLAWRTTRAGDN
ncbi:MAG: hypothetical protein ACREQM_22560 [Candidatus Dormibacteraceae bacterium]